MRAVISAMVMAPGTFGRFEVWERGHFVACCCCEHYETTFHADPITAMNYFGKIGWIQMQNPRRSFRNSLPVLWICGVCERKRG